MKNFLKKPSLRVSTPGKAFSFARVIKLNAFLVSFWRFSQNWYQIPFKPFDRCRKLTMLCGIITSFLGEPTGAWLTMDANEENVPNVGTVWPQTSVVVNHWAYFIMLSSSFIWSWGVISVPLPFSQYGLRLAIESPLPEISSCFESCRVDFLATGPPGGFALGDRCFDDAVFSAVASGQFWLDASPATDAYDRREMTSAMAERVRETRYLLIEGQRHRSGRGLQIFVDAWQQPPTCVCAECYRNGFFLSCFLSTTFTMPVRNVFHCLHNPLIDHIL